MSARADTTEATDPLAQLAAPRFDAIGPERIFHYYNHAAHLRAVVVIDTTRFGISGGGVRMAADLTLAELVRLARAMSYKFAMLDLPCGGAKAGIWLDPADPARPGVMAAFLAAIRPLTESRAYIAGADMGTSATDFAALYGGADNVQDLGRQDFEGLPLEDQLTGYGVVVAARTACEVVGHPLRGARVAIEGFGKVGAGAAKFFAREGARVVALSTIRGTLHDPDGLDIDTLLGLRSTHGDAALDRYGKGEHLPPAALFGVPADIVVPGARPDVIHAENVATLAARLIVPAANIPYAQGAVAALQARGIVALPDFVSNAGGVLAGLVGLQGGDADTAFAAVRDRVSDNVRRILADAQEQHCAPYDAALRLARRQLAVDV